MCSSVALPDGDQVLRGHVHDAGQPQEHHQRYRVQGRGSHSSTLRLNASAFCGIGGTFRGCLGSVYDVRGGIRGFSGCILYQERLRLSLNVDECKPLVRGRRHHHGVEPRQRGARQGVRLCLIPSPSFSIRTQDRGKRPCDLYGPLHNARLCSTPFALGGYHPIHTESSVELLCVSIVQLIVSVT